MTRSATLLALALALALAAIAPAPLAHANGRPAATNGVFFHPNQPESIYIRATFGLLISHDNGCTFRWVCEENIDYGGTYDPKYEIAADGSIYATTFKGLRVSRDGGCSFTTPTESLPEGDPGRIAGRWVDSLELGPGGEIWTATAVSGEVNEVYRSTDAGATFQPMGLSSPTIRWRSIAVAPSDAQRVYVTGYGVSAQPTAHLYATEDGGANWTERPLTGVVLGGAPIAMIAAVDRTDPDRIFLVSATSNGVDGDRLYRSTDGGATFAEVLVTNQAITDVVIRDAANVIAVSGSGTFRSSDAGASFGAAETTPRLGCLGQRADGSLVGCAANWEPDFMAVGSSSNGAQWQKLFRFVELVGPVSCPAGTAGHDVCDAELWSGLQRQFGAKGSLCGAPPDGPPEEPPESGGCCDAGDAPPLGAGLATLWVAWLLSVRARRRAGTAPPRRAPHRR